MRHKGAREEQPRMRHPDRYRGPAVTLGHIRSHGVRHLLIYRSTGFCHHSAVVNADRWPDDTALRFSGRVMLLVVVFLLLVGFAAGYGVRELVSRRRRATERKRYQRD